MIAVSRFDAEVVVVALTPKVPVVALVHELAPLPEVAGIEPVGDRVSPLPVTDHVTALPVALVTVTTAPETVAEMPDCATVPVPKHADGALEHWAAFALIAASRFSALLSWPVVPEPEPCSI